MSGNNQCRGTCKFHVPGEVPGEGDWVCNNWESEYYGLETGYEDECVDFSINDGEKYDKIKRFDR